MKKLLLAALIIISGGSVFAQKTIVSVNTVLRAEENFKKLVIRKGIKDGFLAVTDPDGIVFKPGEVKIVDFYGKIDKQPGTLTWEPKFARISANGDLAFTAGPYVYQNGASEDDKVYGDYVSIWRLDPDDNKLKLLIDLGVQHPEPEQQETPDFTEADSSKRVTPSKDPFNGRIIILNTDKIFNHELEASTMATYKEFLSANGRLYFPGFEPIIGQNEVMKFINNEGISMSAETTNVGRSTSNDMAYSYGRARIKKGNIVSNYNYVRIWQIDPNHKWDVLLEVFSSVEQ
jgi:hypothetical protein